MKKILVTLAFLFSTGAAYAGEFTIAFDWDGLERCTSGRPNTVESPVFEVHGAPEGTKWIYFKLVDLDVPDYRHGGGWAAYTGDGPTEAGAFTYKSPCPPNGQHTYEWRAAAAESNDFLGQILGVATAQRKYPE